MFKHILIPTDGSDLSKDAVQYGMSLAKAVSAKVTGITVYAVHPDMLTETPESCKKRMTTDAMKYLEQVKDAAKAGVVCDTIQVEHEHPFEAIIETAKAKGCDLIVMASHGRRGISAIVLGSETLKVLTHSTIPDLVYRKVAPKLF
jgi:nucleotide-binding universal stress UspA family protein